jgi:hypothetical protein
MRRVANGFAHGCGQIDSLAFRFHPSTGDDRREVGQLAEISRDYVAVQGIIHMSTVLDTHGPNGLFLKRVGTTDDPHN